MKIKISDIQAKNIEEENVAITLELGDSTQAGILFLPIELLKLKTAKIVDAVSKERSEEISFKQKAELNR